MLKDITIGQYFPGRSVLHRLDARMKIVLTLCYIILLFLAKTALGLAVGVVLLLVVYGLSGVPFGLMVKGLKPVVPIIVFTAVLNLFFVTGDPIVSLGWFTVTWQGLQTTAFMVVRILCLIAGSSLLTYTTSPIALTDAIERLLSPLKRFRVPVHELAMMMTIALRFIPTLIEETDKIISAQKARGADMETGSLLKRAKALVPILIPLFVSAFRRADELALAMECRCYRGGEGRTRMKQLHLRPADFVAAGMMACCIVGVALLNFLPGLSELLRG